MLRQYEIKIIFLLDNEMFGSIFEKIRANSNAEARTLINKDLKSRNYKLNEDYKIGSIRLKPAPFKKYLDKKTRCD